MADQDLNVYDYLKTFDSPHFVLALLSKLCFAYSWPVVDSKSEICCFDLKRFDLCFDLIELGLALTLSWLLCHTSTESQLHLSLFQEHNPVVHLLECSRYLFLTFWSKVCIGIFHAWTWLARFALACGWCIQVASRPNL